jgi:hypothetical protein
MRPPALFDVFGFDVFQARDQGQGNRLGRGVTRTEQGEAAFFELADAIGVCIAPVGIVRAMMTSTLPIALARPTGSRIIITLPSPKNGIAGKEADVFDNPGTPV